MCDECNDYFGRTLEDRLDRDSLEGVTRLNAGLKDPANGDYLSGEKVKQTSAAILVSHSGSTALRSVGYSPNQRSQKGHSRACQLAPRARVISQPSPLIRSSA